jgi:hypothetical protein
MPLRLHARGAYACVREDNLREARARLQPGLGGVRGWPGQQPRLHLPRQPPGSLVDE